MKIQSRCVLACLSWAAAPLACAAPALNEPADAPGAASTLTSLIMPLVLIAAAAAAATYLLTRWKGSIIKREGPLQLLQILALGPRERLALVKAGPRYLVVGIGAGGISRIAEYDEIPEASGISAPIPDSALSVPVQKGRTPPAL